MCARRAERVAEPALGGWSVLKSQELGERIFVAIGGCKTLIGQLMLHARQCEPITRESEARWVSRSHCDEMRKAQQTPPNSTQSRLTTQR
jgi:hypothetical protein